MKKLLFTATILLPLSLSYSAWAIHIPNSEIQVFANTFYADWTRPENTLDEDITKDNYWVGTDGLTNGVTDWLAYKFANPYSISQIDFLSFQTNTLDIILWAN